MNSIELKSDLYKLIDKVNDATILNAIKAILVKQVSDTDFWDDLIAGQIPKAIDELSASILGWVNHVRYGDTCGIRKAMLSKVKRTTKVVSTNG